MESEMIFRVEYFGGPNNGKSELAERKHLPGVKRVYAGKPQTRAIGHYESAPKDVCIDFTRYFLKPMTDNGARFYMYVHEDSLDEWSETYE